MKTIDGSSIMKVVRAFIVMALSLLIMISCYVYHNYITYKSIKVVVKDSASVEYGSANYNVNKLIKKVDGEIVSVKKDVDTSKIGEQEVILSVKKENVVKDVPIVVNVVDTIAPVISLKEDKITITKGDNYDFNSNIKSVNDAVDGDLSYLKEVQEDSNYYYNFTVSDIGEVGNHDVLVTAKDKAGNVSTSKFVVEVVAPKPKPVYTAPSNPTYTNVPANPAGGDVVSIASSLVGSPYVYGANGPYGFDCSGLVQYVYSRVGINVSRSSSSQYYEGVGVPYSEAKPGDILSWGHGGVVTHSAIYIGNGQMIHATNPSQGVIVSSVSGWENGSVDNLMAVRRVK